MGRDSFTYDSKIIIKTEKVAKLLTALDYYFDEDDDLEQELIACLSDYDWQFVEQDLDLLEFKQVDQSDHNFDWEEFEQLVPFLEDGSYYEETGDSDDGEAIYGGYITSSGLLKKLFSIENVDSDNEVQRKLISEELFNVDKCL